METFITIATFQYPHQAYIIKAKLESEERKIERVGGTRGKWKVL